MSSLPARSRSCTNFAPIQDHRSWRRSHRPPAAAIGTAPPDRAAGCARTAPGRVRPRTAGRALGRAATREPKRMACRRRAPAHSDPWPGSLLGRRIVRARPRLRRRASRRTVLSPIPDCTALDGHGFARRPSAGAHGPSDLMRALELLDQANASPPLRLRPGLANGPPVVGTAVQGRGHQSFGALRLRFTPSNTGLGKRKVVTSAQ